MPDPNDPSYQAWYPPDRDDPPPGTFEIGLVLAGAVSAGAYTAGVLDFLYEALDTWHRAKLADLEAGRSGDDRTVPDHKVRLHIVTGASAGGMNGAISAVALRYDYPRAWSDQKIADSKTARNKNRIGSKTSTEPGTPSTAPGSKRSTSQSFSAPRTSTREFIRFSTVRFSTKSSARSLPTRQIVPMTRLCGPG